MTEDILTYNDTNRPTMTVSTITEDKKRKKPSLRIFENFYHYTFAIHTGKHTIPKSQEILPTNKGKVNFRTFAGSLNNL